MGLAAIDPHSVKVQTKLSKIPKFGVNTVDLIAGKIQPSENVKTYKEMYGHPDAVRHSVQMTIHFFVHVNSEVFKSLYLSQN